MKNLLLGIIAINLTFISLNLSLNSIEPLQAEEQIDRTELQYIIRQTVEAYCEVGHYHNFLGARGKYDPGVDC